jgi:hypothetical protein
MRASITGLPEAKQQPPISITTEHKPPKSKPCAYASQTLSSSWTFLTYCSSPAVRWVHLWTGTTQLRSGHFPSRVQCKESTNSTSLTKPAGLEMQWQAEYIWCLSFCHPHSSTNRYAWLSLQHQLIWASPNDPNKIWNSQMTHSWHSHWGDSSPNWWPRKLWLHTLCRHKPSCPSETWDWTCYRSTCLQDPTSTS